MKKIIRYIVIIIFMLIDIYILYYFNSLQNKRGFIILNFIVFYFIDKRIFRKKIRFYDALILIAPGIGFCGLLIEEILSENLKINQDINEISDFEHDILKVTNVSTPNLQKNISIRTGGDIFLNGSADEKKFFIISTNFKEDSDKVYFLKKGLKDIDKEVSHYSAVALNFIDKKYRKLIKEKVENSIEKVETYMQYVCSDLLEGDILEVYVRKIEDSLKDLELLNSLDEELIAKYNFKLNKINKKEYEEK